MITIDKDKPMPNGYGRGAPRKYPFDELAVGESFFVPGKKANDLYSSADCAKLRCPGRKFSRRTVTENGVTGVRVWRVQ